MYIGICLIEIWKMKTEVILLFSHVNKLIAKFSHSIYMEACKMYRKFRSHIFFPRIFISTNKIIHR